MAAVAGPQTPQRPLPGGFINTPAPAPTIFAPQAAQLRQNQQPPAAINNNAAQSSAPQLSPVDRAARTINETLRQEQSFPELEKYVVQGMSGEYEMPTNPAWLPYQKLRMYDLPSSIIEQANQTVGGLQMGVMPGLSHCWAVMDNCLYLWDYTVQNPELIGYEENPHPITAVKLIKPKPGVFVKEITHLIVVATSDTMLLLGVSTQTTQTGAKTVALYNTRMWIHTKGVNVRQIEASNKTGRIFFLDAGSEDIYEFQYQQEEGWFRGKCARVCHTKSSYDFMPPPVKAVTSLFGPNQAQKRLRRLVLDDTRDLLYTLSDTSEIKVWLVKEQVKLGLFRALAGLLQNLGHFTGPTDLLYGRDVRIVDLSVISATEGGKLNVMATTNTGCRLYLSAMRSYNNLADAQNPPSSMQVLHVRFPPKDSNAPLQQQQSGSTAMTQYSGAQQGGTDTSSRALSPTDSAYRLAPGYFMAFQQPNPQQSRRERVFCAAPDFARLKNAQQGASTISSGFVEFGQWIDLPSGHSMVALATPDFAATNTPVGFGNEMAVQFDRPSAEIAIMTADGVQTIRRRRLVDVFASMMVYASTDEEGRDGDIKRFVRTYGRGETAATALAVACGQGMDVTSESRVTAVTDPDVIEGARKAFIDHGGKPEYNANAVVDRNAEPIDSVRPSPRHEGLALYVSRLVRSIWMSRIMRDEIKPGLPPTLAPTVELEKLRGIQRDLNTLSDFLNRNKSFIEGLAGPQALGRPSTRQEEIALHGEHRAMNSLVQLINSIVEGISFVLVLFDERLEDILAALTEDSRRKARDLTFEQLFVSSPGRELAKELVKAIVNRNIANGSNVDTVAEALRRRCGSFCSADDVVIFKAQEQVKRASEAGGQSETGRVLLNESQRLFQKVAGSLTEEHLLWAVNQYAGMSFYAGAVQLCLVVAQERDRARRAVTWLRDGSPEGDARKADFEKRKACYDLVFASIQALDRETAAAPQNADGQLTLAARRRSEAYDIIDSSSDTVFQTCLYDWYTVTGNAERLLDVSTPFVLDYLTRRSATDRAHADLLWRYHAHHNDYLAAAATQLELAKGYFDLTLEERIEYLSRARTNASTRSSTSTAALLDGRQNKQQLLREISDLLDVATLQDDILQRMKADPRLSGQRRDVVLAALNTSQGILDVGELFNQFSDQAGYHDINLSIFRVADHRNPADVERSWEDLVRSEHNRAMAEITGRQGGGPEPWERIGMKLQEMGRKLDLDEAIFPVKKLVRKLEAYSLEAHERPPPANWAVEVLMSCGVPPAGVLPELEQLYYANEAPFAGQRAKSMLAGEMVEVCRRWVVESERVGERVVCGSEEGALMVRECLESLLRGRRDLDERGRAEAEEVVRVFEGVIIDEGEPAADEDMAEAEGIDATEAAEDNEPTGLEDIEPEVPERTTFLDYLRSPIISLQIGSSRDAVTLHAHQALLTQSPFFAGECDRLSSTQTKTISLPHDDLHAIASVLEYLYKADYFPTLAGATSMEYDPTVPQPDNEGVALLRHARVYTLAQRFGLPDLSALAHKKIHLTQSTAKGEIAYARFVYREASPDDEAIRKPVAAFWATRSHVLRHEAEQEFKRMCLEFPQFGFDVLSLVLDAQEKRSQRVEAQSSGTASGRKRQRISGIVP
ncbi:hypothetical protein B0A55_02521 [Friedmanniomyces simplex]|uniref:BTB domain-containing protein n=1 Tax=Friedmanniomyces simplex TaxID=329884 RepID=A0A4U0XNV2_9PEZI|nr:hypothetical protein B0A55_02521 [Friedmanniomyces simplex]